MEHARQCMSEDSTATFRETTYPEVAIRLESKPSQDAQNKLIGRVSVGGDAETKVRCVVDQIALSKLLHVMAN